METDKRYAATTDVPKSLLRKDKDSVKNEFNIRGKFRDGRASYLDMSATTPLDPRVLDVMAPYMVSDDVTMSMIFLHGHKMIIVIFISLFGNKRSLYHVSLSMI